MKYVTHILLSVLLVSVSVSVFEWYIRINFPQRTINDAFNFSFSCFEKDERMWIKLATNKSCILRSHQHVFQPVEVKTNSVGLRNPEIPFIKTPDETRILFVGDSFTMGWGIKEEHTFVRKTESLLRSRGLAKVSAINAGFSAADPSGYYIYLKESGLKLDPDIVVVGFYIGNDIISRNDIDWKQIDEQGLPLAIQSKATYVDRYGILRFTDIPLQYRFPLLRSSHAFLLLANTISSKLVKSSNYNERMFNQLACLYKPTCHDLDNAKTDVQRLFSAMKNIVHAQGKKLIVLMIPDEYQVTANPSYTYFQDLPLLPSQRRYINNEFIRFFESQDIEYLDILPLFMERAKEQLYFPGDGHWNEAGHTLAAEYLASKLEAILFPPRVTETE